MGNPVAEDRGGNAQALDGHRLSGGTGYEFGLMAEHGAGPDETVVAVADEELGFLLERHRLEHIIDVAGVELWCRLCHNGC